MIKLSPISQNGISNALNRKKGDCVIIGRSKSLLPPPPKKKSLDTENEKFGRYAVAYIFKTLSDS